MSLYLGSEKVENVTAQITLPVEPSDDLPLADGTASAGVSKKFSRADHVHPMNENEILLADTNIKLPLSTECNDITYGDGKFIVISYGSTATYSTDAIHWTEITLPSVANRTAITYGNGKFVAVSASKGIIYSTDGINWSSVDIEGMYESVIYGNGKFIATNLSSQKIIYSIDGINWNQKNLYNYPHSTAYGNGKFVIVSGFDNVAEYSTDGINWTKADASSAGSWEQVIYNAGKFVAIGNSATAIYSTDGISWTTMTLPLNRPWGSIAYGNDKFVAINRTDNTAIYSTDGINWTTTALPSNNGWQAITYGDGKFVAVNKDKLNGIVAYSTDGIHWSSVTKALQSPNGTDIHEQVRNALQITASDVNAIPSTLSGTAGQVLTKTVDGQKWKDVTPHDRCFRVDGVLQNQDLQILDSSEFSDLTHQWNQLVLTDSGDFKNVNIPMPCIDVQFNIDNQNTIILRYAGIAPLEDYAIFSGIYYNASDALQYSVSLVYQLGEPGFHEYNIIPIRNIDPSTTTPVAPTETGAVGASTAYARGDHSHPSELFVCTMNKNSDTYTCNKTFSEIKSAYDAGKICIAISSNNVYYLDCVINGASINFVRTSGASREDRFIYYINGTVSYDISYSDPKACKITLTASGWSNNQQIVTCTGVSASATSQEIRVMPADASKTSAYVSCGISCIAQASDKLTFACDKVPTTAIDVYVVMQSLNFQS